MWGKISILLSAVLFYAATAVIKLARQDAALLARVESGISQGLSSEYFLFFRFLVGAFVFPLIFVMYGKKPEIKEKPFLFLRTVSNIVALYCFFQAINLTSLAQANILNMTYPLFIAIFSVLWLDSRKDWLGYALCLMSFCGTVMVVGPLEGNFSFNSFWGVMSGFSASISIIALQKTRQHNDTETVLFVMFILGTVLCGLIFHKSFFSPSLRELAYLLLSALLGIAGQLFITFGFRSVSAVEGAILGSSRIIFAALISPLLFLDEKLTALAFIGALAVFLANVLMAWNTQRARKINNKLS